MYMLRLKKFPPKENKKRPFQSTGWSDPAGCCGVGSQRLHQEDVSSSRRLKITANAQPLHQEAVNSNRRLNSTAHEG